MAELTCSLGSSAGAGHRGEKSVAKPWPEPPSSRELSLAVLNKPSVVPLRPAPIVMTIEEISYRLRVRSWLGRVLTDRQLLDDVNGNIGAGRLVAVMGASGSGKTTLLSTLAGRARSSQDISITGRVLFNGRPGSEMRSQLAYVTQADIVYETSTPREAITLSAMLRLPGAMPRSEKLARVEALISRLNLTKCADTVIGGKRRPGISGGERKRTNVSVELVTNPAVILLDEATTGLDSVNAFMLFSVLKELATDGHTVVTSIHQPSSDVVHLFDDLLLLHEGKTAFFGPAADARGFFADAGFPLKPRVNPADHYIAVLAGPGAESVTELWASRATGLSDRGLAPGSPGVSSAGGRDPAPAAAPTAPVWTQFALLCDRSWKNSVREPLFARTRALTVVVYSLILGLLFFNIGDGQSSVQDREGVLFSVTSFSLFNSLTPSVTVFFKERAVLLRERGAGMYLLGSYFCAKVAAELPFQLGFPLSMACITYFMAKLTPTAAAFLVFAATVVLNSLLASALGLSIGAGVPSPEVANAVTPLIVMPLMLVGGLFANKARLTPYWLWLQAISPIVYAYDILLRNEFTNKAFTCGPPPAPCAYRTGDQVLAYLQVTTPAAKDFGILLGYAGAALVLAYALLAVTTRGAVRAAA